MKKILVVILMALMMVSCAKKNPLIRSDVIQYLKTSGDTWVQGNFPLTDCGAFYAGYISSLPSDHKADCDAWAADRFTNITEDFHISDATTQNITDSELWQQVYPKSEYLNYSK